MCEDCAGVRMPAGHSARTDSSLRLKRSSDACGCDRKSQQKRGIVHKIGERVSRRAIFRAWLLRLSLADPLRTPAVPCGPCRPCPFPPEDVDFHNLVIRVKGKGGKHRLVPCIEFRKVAGAARVICTQGGQTTLAVVT
jgi:hypothetical protein